MGTPLVLLKPFRLWEKMHRASGVLSGAYYCGSKQNGTVELPCLEMIFEQSIHIDEVSDHPYETRFAALNQEWRCDERGEHCLDV